MSKSGVWIGTRRKVYARDALKCTYCGVECVEGREFNCRPARNMATLDHVIPRAMGGSNGFANLVTACLFCNVQKAKRTADEYRAWLAVRKAAA